MSKIMRVYYDNAGHPYKDSSLSTLYPIVGNEFTGANNTSEIHFYTDNLGIATWIANCKLPNGTLVNRLLVPGIDAEGDQYFNLPLDSELTSVVGHLKIGLNGYAGNISIDEEELENNDLVVISGTPTIIATGIIDIAMNYSPIVIPVSDLTPTEYQQLLALIGTKTNEIDTILVVNDIYSLDAYDYGQNQIIYDRETKLFYKVISGEFVLEELDFVSAETFANALLTKVDKSSSANIVYGTDNSGNQITIPIETYSGSVVRKNASGQVTVPTTPTENTDASSKGYVDSVVATVKSNTFQVVSNLPQQGEEGIIYLVEISSSVYEQFIWETNGYISLGTTQIDLSDYVPKSRTIAGINLEDDISEVELVSSITDNELSLTSNNPVQNKVIAKMFNKHMPYNLLNTNTLVAGYIIADGTFVSGGDTYVVTDYIPVEEGQIILFFVSGNLSSPRFICAYNQSKIAIESEGFNTVPNPVAFSVRSGIKYVRFSFAATYLEQSPMIVALPSSANLINLNDLVDGYTTSDGNIYDSPSYKTTGYLSVEQDDILYFFLQDANTTFRFLSAFDENKSVIVSAGSNNALSSYTVPANVKFIRISFASTYADGSRSLVFFKKPNGTYVPYVEPYWVLKPYHTDMEYIEGVIDNLFENSKFGINQLNFAELQNYFNKDATDILENTYVASGYEVSSSDYFATGFIEVEPNTTYSFAATSSIMEARFVDEYNADKVSTLTSSNVSTLTTSATTKYIRVSFSNYGRQTACITKGDIPTLGLEYKYLIPSNNILQKPSVKAFLPKEICCVIGKTIEIYNDQVLPCANKYHFRWICDIGKALNRKFSITAINTMAGNHTLKLEIYDDNMNLIYILSSILKVVSPLSENKSICPIGDSLTNNKYWLRYIVENLTDKITFVGTRLYTSNIYHEGRSGWSTIQYLSNTQYTYEQPATPNPFWDPVNNKFSWSYYKSTYSINPNVVQVWLGTNDLLGMTGEQFATNIKTMIAAIRDNDATIPIEICLTILPAEQNGIGAQTSSDGFSSLSGRWQYEWWNTIISGVAKLEEELLALEDNNLHIIPLVCSHDSKYNFGLVETPVNPNTPSITEPMPIEGVHPQQNGYEQIGDILYSCYSAHL